MKSSQSNREDPVILWVFLLHFDQKSPALPVPVANRGNSRQTRTRTVGFIDCQGADSGKKLKENYFNITVKRLILFLLSAWMISFGLNKVGRHIVSVLGQDEGYTVKYNPLPEGVPEGAARGTLYPELSPNTDIISF